MSIKLKKSILLFCISCFIASNTAYALSFKSIIKKVVKIAAAPVVISLKAAEGVVQNPANVLNVAKDAVKGSVDVLKETVSLAKDVSSETVEKLVVAITGQKTKVNAVRAVVQKNKDDLSIKKKELDAVAEEVDLLLKELQALKSEEIVYYSVAQTFNKAIVRTRDIKKMSLDLFWQKAYPDHVVAIQAVLPLYGVGMGVDPARLQSCLQQNTSEQWIISEELATERVEECLFATNQTKSWPASKIFDFVSAIPDNSLAGKYFSIYDCELKKVLLPIAESKNLTCEPSKVANHPFMGSEGVTALNLKNELLSIKKILLQAQSSVDQSIQALQTADASLVQSENELSKKLQELQQTGSK